MNRICVLLLFAFFYISSLKTALGQLKLGTTDDMNRKIIDTIYIKQIKEKIGIHFLANTKFNKWEIEHIENDQKLEYNPNEVLKVGGGFFYKWLGVAFTVKVPQSDKDIAEKGNTYSFDTQFNLYNKKFILDLYQQYYKGYYINDYEKLFHNWDKEVNGFPKRPDLRTINYGGNFTYIFNNKKFSYRAAFVMNERQIRSAGSFLAGVFFTGTRLSGDSAIIWRDIADKFNEENPVSWISTQSFGFTVGYTYTLKFSKSFFVNAAINLGPMYTFSKIKSTKTNRSDPFEPLSAKFMVRGAIGYNHPKFYLGLATLKDEYLLRASELTYRYQLGWIKFFVGKRFNFNKQLKIFNKKII